MSRQSVSLLPQLPLAVSAPRLRRIQFDRKSVDKARTAEEPKELSLKLGLGVGRLGPDEIAVELQISLEDLPSCTIEVSCGARFRLSAPEEVADVESVLHTVAAKHAPAALYPFVREGILSTMMKAGLKLPALPLLDFSIAFDESEVSVPPFSQTSGSAEPEGT